MIYHRPLKIKSILAFTFFTFLSMVLYADVSDLTINEIAPSGSTHVDEFNDVVDWFEIYNAGNTPVNLKGLFLSDNQANLTKWKIDTSIILNPANFIVFYADKHPEKGALHTNFKLKSKGESLLIAHNIAGNVVVINMVEYGAVQRNASYGRKPDGSDSFVVFGETTPNSTNNNALLYLEPPQFSLPNGIYKNHITLTIIHPQSDVTIRYLKGGYFPKKSSKIYDYNPLELWHNTTIRAIAVKEGYATSEPANGSFLFQEDMPNGQMPLLDILNLTTDPHNFFDDQIGIYVVGKNGKIGFCSSEPANFNHSSRDWERPVNMNLINKDGTSAFTVNGGIQIGGACSRLYAQKGLNLYLRRKYYGDKEIEYPLFNKRDYSAFRRLKLRNSGQDFLRLGFRDATIHTALMGNFDLEFLASHSVLGYLNGEFWGVYNLREYYAGEYFEARFGLDEDEIDVIKNPGMIWSDIKLGSSEDFLDLKEFARQNDLSLAENYTYVSSKLDINNFIDFWSTMIYLANMDWPDNNNYIWRDRENGGKWRYLFQDTDNAAYAKLLSNGTPDYNSLDCVMLEMLDQDKSRCLPEATLLFRKLVQNKSFRNEYVQRTCTHMELFLDGATFDSHIDSMENLFEPYFEAQIDKWVSSGDNVWGGGSIWSWYGWVDKFKSFFHDRPAIMREHIMEEFELTGTYTLQILGDRSKGEVLVHRTELSVPPFYEGEYFQHIPIRIKAKAIDGYQFLYWLETGDTSRVIDFVSVEQASLTPVFDKVLNHQNFKAPTIYLSPNPATEVIHFGFNYLAQVKHIKVLTFVGQTVINETIDFTSPSYKLNISKLKSGVYTLLITFIDGNNVVAKFIKK